jgi:multicomponent Na+:H+ antiporter subunit F
MDETLFQNLLNYVLIFMVFMLVLTSIRLIKGPRIADRMLAIDMITTILIGIIALLAVIEEQSLLVDVALALSALSFIATLAIARFVGEGRVF